jgi:transcription antitermination factor NusG
MSKLTKEYDIAETKNYKIHICPNYNENTIGYKTDEIDVIMIEKVNEEEFVTFSIDEAKEIIKALTEIIDAVENEPMVGDSVTILDGELKGMTGKIFDIDTVATERELVVLIDKTENHDKFYAYIDKDNVE